MRKLSNAQEMVLRQVAAGQVKLVYVADNEHSVRRWDALDRNGRKCNRQYDALHRADLVAAPMASGDMMWVERKVLLNGTVGEDAVKALGLVGVLVYQDFEIGMGTSWMIRKERDADEQFVLYRNGEVSARYRHAGDVYEAFRRRCPLHPDREAELSR